MKQLLLILLVGLIPIVSFSQFHIGGGLGYDTHTAKPIANLNMGIEASIVVLDAEIRPSMSRNLPLHNYMGGKFGINIVHKEDNISLIPAIGYYYDDMSSDNKTLNKSYIGYSLKSVYMITETGGVHLETLYINNSLQITIGMTVKII